MRNMLIGIDLDHTIINYNTAFLNQAKDWGLVPTSFDGDKKTIKSYIQLNAPNGERDWMRLQGYIYGKGISQAQLMDGFQDFVNHCHQHNYPIVIISHKTQFGHFDDDMIDLREAALSWMEQNNFFHSQGLNIVKENIFFNDTRQLKVQKIKTLGCTHFIDDLPEVFQETSFPDLPYKYLLIDNKHGEAISGVEHCLTWYEIAEKIFNE